MVAALARAGVDIRPEAMGVTWDDVGEAMRTLPAYVRDAGLWFSVARRAPGTRSTWPASGSSSRAATRR